MFAVLCVLIFHMAINNSVFGVGGLGLSMHVFVLKGYNI